MQIDSDLVILGGGCAGLSLALRLAEHAGQCRRVTVVEPRSIYTNDRSWCFWRLGPHRFEPLVTHAWSSVAVRSATQTVEVDCTRTPYQLLQAGAFYDHACALIAGSNTVRLLTGVAARGPPVPASGGWRIETSVGDLTATQVIDTRPPNLPQPNHSVLWQSFLGEELICERPMFDSARAQLMDFANDAPGAVAFTYVLPLAANRALVETTLFDPQPRSAADLAPRQLRAVQRVCGAGQPTVVRTETGILPMGITRSAAVIGRGHLRAGLMSGAARPATGYAFQRIQRWADACAGALRNGREVTGHEPDPLLTRAMDHLFLELLRAHPERGPELFVSLFRRTPARRLVRFLSDRATVIDRIAIAASLPTGMFLRQLLSPAPRGAVRAETP